MFGDNAIKMWTLNMDKIKIERGVKQQGRWLIYLFEVGYQSLLIISWTWSRYYGRYCASMLDEQ